MISGISRRSPILVMKRNGYCWGIVGVNGAKTRAHVISLGNDMAQLCVTLMIKWEPVYP